VPYAIAAALIVLAGGGSTAYALKHKHTAADTRPAVTVTITVPPKAAATSGQPASTPATTPTTVPVVVTSSSSPSPSVSPGTLHVSPQPIYLPRAAPYTTSFTLTAVGGPVTYSISFAGNEPYLTVNPQNSTLQSGQQAQITVTVTPPVGALPPSMETATVNPGGLVITIVYNGVIQ